MGRAQDIAAVSEWKRSSREDLRVAAAAMTMIRNDLKAFCKAVTALARKIEAEADALGKKIDSELDEDDDDYEVTGSLVSALTSELSVSGIKEYSDDMMAQFRDPSDQVVSCIGDLRDQIDKIKVR